MLKQEDFLQMLKGNNRKALNRFCRKLFNDMGETMEFLLAMSAFLDVNRKGDISIRCYEMASEFTTKARSRFSQLPDCQFLEAICYYHKFLEKEKKRRQSGESFGFDITLFLGGSKRGEINQAKRIILKLSKIISDNPLPDPKDKTNANKTLYVVGFFLGLVAYTNITCTWENFLVAAAEDEAAKQSLKGLLQIILMYNQAGFNIIPANEWNETRDLTIGWLQNAVVALNFSGNQIINLPVPNQSISLVRELVDGLLNEVRERQKEFVALTLWFGDNRQSFDEIFGKMWFDIKTKPKHGLRPGGKDFIKIEVSAMKAQGHHKLQFFSEGMKFPEAKVLYWMKENNLPYNFALRLDPERTHLAEYIIKPGLDEENIVALVDQLLIFIALHCYWRIVTAQKGMPFSDRIWQKPVSGKAKSERISHALSTIVRPHFRQLPSGYKASGDAIGRSLGVFKMEPPTGWTFVKKHDRGFIESELITPLFAYSDADIGLA